MTPIEAVVNSSAGYRKVRCAYEDGYLWSDGHIAVRGDYPAPQELPAVAKTWDKNAARAPELEAMPGICILGYRDVVYRSLVAGDVTVWMNEAYRIALQGDGVSVFVVAPNEPITFRKDGVMVGIAMPVKHQASLEDKECEPSDDLVWGSLASEHNGFYLQSREAIRKKLTDGIREARQDRARAIDRRDEAIEEIQGYDDDLFDMESKLSALNKLEAVAVA